MSFSLESAGGGDIISAGSAAPVRPTQLQFWHGCSRPFRPSRVRRSAFPILPKTPDYPGYPNTKLGDAGKSARSAYSTRGSPESPGERGGPPVGAPSPRLPPGIAYARASSSFGAAWSEKGCPIGFGLAPSRRAGLCLHSPSASPRAATYSVSAASACRRASVSSPV